MLQFEVGGQRYPLSPGDLLVGADPACAIRLEGPGVLPRHLVVSVTAAAVAVRAASPDAEAQVNGVRLGTDPTPVLHGDKVTIGAHEIQVSDPGRGGGTMVMGAPVVASAASTTPQKGPTRNGRCVSLTDGREYAVTEKGLVFGREASSDVVVTGTEVSRRHAEIRSTPDGYVLTDFSSNGTRVNGQRIASARVLQRADVIAIGPEEFRFYAEASPEPPKAPEPPPSPPPGAVHQLQNTLAGIPPIVEPPKAAAPPPPAPAPAPPSPPAAAAPPPPPAPAPPAPAPAPERPVLASLLVRAGTLKGERLAIRTPVVNIGRADYNDLVLPDPSVSTSHAKLQRRGSAWVLVDLESTNGTFVDGEKLTEEAALSPGATVRFGDVSVLFDSLDEGGDEEAAGTKVMQGVKLPPKPAKAEAPPPAPAPVPAPPAPKPAPVPAPAAAAKPAAKAVGTPATAEKKGCFGLLLFAMALPTAAAAAWWLGR
ncbi:MAG: FHA domain-containing protein [Gemmatimonadales bacterium]|nr:FHA domain-containing protein [Gemmatimonadales bacterium]